VTAASANPLVDPITSRLQRDWSILSTIREAASACQRNYRWIETNDASPISVVDFDMIYGTMPSLLAQSLAEDSDERAADGPVAIFGPHAVAYWLPQMGTYTIPPGAIWELLEAKERLGNKVSSTTEQMLQRVHAALDRKDAGSAVAGSNRKVFDVVRDELLAIGGGFEDIELLDSILERATPPDELSRATPADSTDAFNKALLVLNSRRPDTRKQRSNLYDAVNVMWTLGLYREGRGQRILPQLLSCSNWIMDQQIQALSGIRPDRGGARGVELFQGRQYLVVSEGLRRDCENSFSTVVDNATSLIRDTSHVIKAYDEAIEAAKSAMHSSAIAAKLRASHAAEHLEAHRHKYLKTWGWLLIPDTQAMQADRIGMINRLCTPQWGKRIRSVLGENAGQAVQLLASRLRAERDSNSLFDPSFRHEWEQTHREDPAETQPILGTVDDDGTPLTEADVAPVNGAHAMPRQYVLHFDGLPRSAFVALSAPTTAGGRPLRLTWKHRVDVGTLWALLSEGISRIIDKTEAEDLVISVYSSIELARWQVTSSEIVPLETVLAKIPTLEYIEFRAGDRGMFADVTPLANGEWQLGLVVPWRLAKDQKFSSWVGNLMKQTCTAGSQPYAELLDTLILAATTDMTPKAAKRQ
jgi:hypothetical protein